MDEDSSESEDESQPAHEPDQPNKGSGSLSSIERDSDPAPFNSSSVLIDPSVSVPEVATPCSSSSVMSVASSESEQKTISSNNLEQGSSGGEQGQASRNYEVGC